VPQISTNCQEDKKILFLCLQVKNAEASEIISGRRKDVEAKNKKVNNQT
jgi:hypothetical protein